MRFYAHENIIALRSSEITIMRDLVIYRDPWRRSGTVRGRGTGSWSFESWRGEAGGRRERACEREEEEPVVAVVASVVEQVVGILVDGQLD